MYYLPIWPSVNYILQSVHGSIPQIDDFSTYNHCGLSSAVPETELLRAVG